MSERTEVVKLEDIINKIRNGTNLIIKGNKYKVFAKAKYVTENNPENWYVKVFLSDHCVLVLSPSDSFVAVGRDVGSIGIDEPFGDIIEYQGEKYKQTTRDYQILINLEFGDPVETEAEVRFWDYEGIDDPNRILSLGSLTRTGKRADVVVEVIDVDDIQFGNYLC